MTRIEFEQINWKNSIFYLSERTKKNSKEEKINKIQQEFSQHESCLLSKQDFFFGGEGVGALRESSLSGCESQITWVVVVFCFLFVLFSFFVEKVQIQIFSNFWISCKYSDNFVVIISLICQQVTYRLADTLLSGKWCHYYFFPVMANTGEYFRRFLPGYNPDNVFTHHWQLSAA